MQDRNSLIWLDGQWLPASEAKVSVLTHTLHYGYGCFEGIRAYETATGPALFRLPEHLRRLEDSARILAIDLPFDRATLTEACRDAVTRNGLNSAYVRPLVFLGDEKPADSVRRLRRQWPERSIVVEVADENEALAWLLADADILQLEKWPVEAVHRIKQHIAPGSRTRLAAAGGINSANAEAYARAGADILVTSAPYFAPPRDVAVTLTAA